MNKVSFEIPFRDRVKLREKQLTGERIEDGQDQKGSDSRNLSPEKQVNEFPSTMRRFSFFDSSFSQRPHKKKSTVIETNSIAEQQNQKKRLIEHFDTVIKNKDEMISSMIENKTRIIGDTSTHIEPKGEVNFVRDRLANNISYIPVNIPEIKETRMRSIESQLNTLPGLQSKFPLFYLKWDKKAEKFDVDEYSTFISKNNLFQQSDIEKVAEDLSYRLTVSSEKNVLTISFTNR